MNKNTSLKWMGYLSHAAFLTTYIQFSIACKAWYYDPTLSFPHALCVIAIFAALAHGFRDYCSYKGYLGS